ncbi:mycofactocin system FadH/OYE family oxidoreductase 1 [Cryptosporangium sp. NPDC048952]|uniref:mycofactocin system FadH/OYE family oxidoreductase 1 n=1 Tax=Cryptosporangium sp. NPDC048952 TaxID=3363961 RepID=UPI0037230D04
MRNPAIGALLTEAVPIAGVLAPSRVVFGPHETNLARGRELGDRAGAYYAARAAGGAGVLVTEIASVTPDDWPYERAPLASACSSGWAAIAAACRPYGTVVLAGLGHAGLQGSSAYSQSVLWGPSAVADVVTREMPAVLSSSEISSVIDGFASAAASAVTAGLDGVEINAGTYSLVRQFLSGLTNLRSDVYGVDRSRFLRDLIASVRAAVGPDRVLALRLSCDEDAPWAGITPDLAAGIVDEVSGSVDLLTVVRGGHYSSTRYRPTARTEPGFNRELCRAMRSAAAGRVPVVLQGSVVSAAMAQEALDAGVADLVEMTRAQIAEPRLVALVRAGSASRVRPCLLCNQACQVRDVRNPIVSCVVEPRSGHELLDPAPDAPVGVRDEVLVVGGGPAGLEAARVLALQGHRVRLVERSGMLGGALRVAATGPGRERLAALADWQEAECRALGVRICLNTEVTPAEVADRPVVLATGSRSLTPDRAAAWRAAVGRAAAGRAAAEAVPFERSGTRRNGPGPADSSLAAPAPQLAPAGSVPVGRGVGPVVADVLAVLAGTAELPDGPVVVNDPIGGPVGVGVAELLAQDGRDVRVVTPDPVLGARTPELAEVNFRLEALGVRRELRTRVHALHAGAVELEHVWTGTRRTLACAAIVDCGHRLPDDTFADIEGPRAGDCVAPRTALEAIREARQAAHSIALRVSGRTAGGVGTTAPAPTDAPFAAPANRVARPAAGPPPTMAPRTASIHTGPPLPAGQKPRASALRVTSITAQ